MASYGKATRDALRQTFGPLAGARVPGGCADCDAYQTVEPAAAGVWLLAVHHDDACPFFMNLEARRARRA